MKYFLSSLFLFLVLVGCSYKPSSYYAKSAIVGKVYVDLKVDIENAQNSVSVKDATNEMILNQFDAILTDKKEEADTLVVVSLSSVGHSTLTTGDDGYTKRYRTSVTIEMSYQKTGEEKKTIKVNDFYDYSIESDSIITDQKKKLAVKRSIN